MWYGQESVGKCNFLGIYQVSKQKGKDMRYIFLKKEPERQRSLCGPRWRVLLDGNSLPKSQGGSRELKITGSDQAFVFFATLRL